MKKIVLTGLLLAVSLTFTGCGGNMNMSMNNMNHDAMQSMQH